MSDENKKPNGGNIEIPKLPDLSKGERGSLINNRGNRGEYDKGWDRGNGKVHEILDKGHPGIPPPPQRPIEKK